MALGCIFHHYKHSSFFTVLCFHVIYTRLNNIGMFSVGSHPFCPTMHSNPTYTSRCNKYAECVIYSSESRTNLTTSTYNIRSSRSSGRYRINADCRHTVDIPPGFSIMDRNITDGSRSARRRNFNPHTRSTHNGHLSTNASQQVMHQNMS